MIRDTVAAITSYLPAWLRRKIGIDGIAPPPPSRRAASTLGTASVGQSAAAAAQPQNSEVRAKVGFDKMPKGTRASSEQSRNTDFEMNQGYAVAGAW